MYTTLLGRMGGIFCGSLCALYYCQKYECVNTKKVDNTGVNVIISDADDAKHAHNAYVTNDANGVKDDSVHRVVVSSVHGVNDHVALAFLSLALLLHCFLSVPLTFDKKCIVGLNQTMVIKMNKANETYYSENCPSTQDRFFSTLYHSCHRVFFCGILSMWLYFWLAIRKKEENSMHKNSSVHSTTTSGNRFGTGFQVMLRVYNTSKTIYTPTLFNCVLSSLPLKMCFLPSYHYSTLLFLIVNCLF